MLCKCQSVHDMCREISLKRRHNSHSPKAKNYQLIISNREFTSVMPDNWIIVGILAEMWNTGWDIKYELYESLDTQNYRRDCSGLYRYRHYRRMHHRENYEEEYTNLVGHGMSLNLSRCAERQLPALIEDSVAATKRYVSESLFTSPLYDAAISSYYIK